LKDNSENRFEKQEFSNYSTFTSIDLSEYFTLILETSNDLLSILNENFEFEFINKYAFKNVLGYSEAEIIGSPFLSLIHPNDVKNDMNITKMDIVNKNQSQEMRLKHKEGHYLWFEISGKTFSDNHITNKTVIISKEISNWKIIEEKLKDSIERNQRITENINDLILILNEEYEFEFVNEIILFKLIGYNKRNLIGNLFINFIHPDDIELALNTLNKRFKIEEESIELRFKHKEENWIWLRCRGKTYYGKNGELKWLIIATNVTEWKQAEERYKNLFDNSPNAITLIDFKGVVIDSNSTSEKLFGYDKDYLIEKNINDLTEIFPIEIKPYFKKVFQASLIGKFPDPIELQIKKSDGNFIWVYNQASLFKIGDKMLIQFIFQDITEKKKAELLEQKFKEQLEKEVQIRTSELNDALEQQKLLLDQILKSSRFKTEFMSTMSHELRTPLNAIIGFTDLLLEGVYGELNEEQLEFVNDIKSSAEHQFDMIKHILDISKIEAGQTNLNIQKFSLNNIVYQIQSSLRPLYKKKGLKFKVKGLETEKEIYADPIRFKEILLNLFSNAVKFTMRGKITFVVQDKYDQWLFKVRDSGIGIARKDFDLIFKEFKRVDSTYVRSVPGTGLGLSLTKRLVNLHGGEISFFSVLGAGTTFTFSISKKLENQQVNN